MTEYSGGARAEEAAIHAIDVERAIGASPDAVFRAWTEPGLLTQWLAQTADVEPGAGGHFRLETVRLGPVPQPYVYSGDYREFVPGRRIVMTWVYNGPRPEDLGEALITIDLVSTGERTTEVRFREEWVGDASKASRDAARKEWLAAFDRLERLVAVDGS